MRPALAIYLCLVSLSTLATGSLHVQLDRIIAAKAGGPVAPRSDDAEFFRRVQLDFSGTIPTGPEVRAFLKNKSPDKRTNLIDQL